MDFQELYQKVSFSVIYSEVLSYLNLDAQTSYGIIDPTSKKYWGDLIKDVIRDKDFLIVSTICQTSGHSLRPLFIQTLTGLKDMSDLAGSIGEIEPPLLEYEIGKFSQGKKTSAAWIDEILQDLQAGTGFLGEASRLRRYFDIVGTTLRHTGLSASMKVCLPVRQTNDLCQSPINFHDTLKKLVLGELYGKQGDYQESASFYTSQGLSDLQGIEQGKIILPTFVQYTAAE